ncbi:histidine phosphatase family protein [Nonomuraea africana]|uniref:histidine phosphatase family protein n=1 Tax=Nonomuraea africana TaxID=46171 RepID=UPI0033CF27F1
MLTIHTIHHVPAARKKIILGTSDDPVDPALRPAFKSQTRSLVRLVCDLIAKSGTSAAAYTSSMQRQKATCELLFADTPIPIVVDERLRQIDNGPQYTGMNFDLGKQDYLNFIDDPFPGGESFRDFAQRIREFLDESSRQHTDHTIITIGWRLSPAIFAHVCRGISLEQAITDNHNISGPFTYE